MTLCSTLCLLLLAGPLLVRPAAAQTCTMPTSGDGCPNRLRNRDCKASAEWFQQNEINCKGKPHAAIFVPLATHLQIDSVNNFTADVAHFKLYPMIGATCDDTHPSVPPSVPFTDNHPGTFATKHTLTPNPQANGKCYGVQLTIRDASGHKTIVDPHIIVKQEKPIAVGPDKRH